MIDIISVYIISWLLALWESITFERNDSRLSIRFIRSRTGLRESINCCLDRSQRFSQIRELINQTD